MSCFPSQLGTVDACSGKTTGAGDALFDYWCEHDCPTTYSKFLFLPEGSVNNPPTYNQASQAQLQDDIVTLFNTYFQTNTITDNINSPAYNSFQNDLLSLCLDTALPGICDKQLTQYCAQFSREQVSNSPILTDFCGCYTPPDPNYLQLSGTGVCDPLCHRTLTVQKAFLENGAFDTCSANVCVIDDVAITIAESTLGEGVNFTSICPACGGKNSNACFCIISGINLTSTLSSIGVYNVNEFCGTGSTCLIEDSNGNIISSKSCEDVNTGIPVPAYAYWPSVGLIVVVVIVLILLVFVFLATRYNFDEKKKQAIVT